MFIFCTDIDMTVDVVEHLLRAVCQVIVQYIF